MKRRKVILYSLLSLQLWVTLTPSTVAAQVNSETMVVETNTSVSPCADNIDWEYKVINGVLYRRLFNYSTNTALSDWEIAP